MLDLKPQLGKGPDAAQTVTLSNGEPNPISILSIAIGGKNPGDFLKTATTCTASLAAKGKCTVSTAFKPTTTGPRNAKLIFTDSPDPFSPHDVTLSGTGVSPTPTRTPTHTPKPTPTHTTKRTPTHTPKPTRDPHAEADANSHTDANPDSHTDTDPHSDANSHPNSNPDAESNSDTGSRHPGHHEHPQSDSGR